MEESVKRKPISITNGTYILSEDEEKTNVFYFYRNDGKVLGDVGRAPMEMYQNYIFMKVMNGEIQDVVMNNIGFDNSVDGKSIRLTVYKMGEKIEENVENKDALPTEPVVTSNKRKVRSLFERFFKPKNKD